VLYAYKGAPSSPDRAREREGGRERDKEGVRVRKRDRKRE